MEKGIWEQAFLSNKQKMKPSGLSPNGLDVGILDDLPSSSDWPLNQKESDESQGEWEAVFSNRSAGAASARVSSRAVPPVDIQPASPPPPQSVPASSTGTLPVHPFDAMRLFREKSKTGPPLFAELGDFLDRIWINLHLKPVEQPPKTFLLCGATRGVGVTFISFYLSLSLALERNMKVLYVDANLDDPRQPSIIPNMQGNPGLASYLAGYRSPETLIMQTQYKNLSVLPSGAREMLNQTNSNPENPRTISEFISYCRADYDATIFDGQPAVEYPNTTAFAGVVDQTILVCKYGFSRREVSKLAIDKLRENGVSVAGVILNERQYPIPSYFYKMLK
jgi:Mrp family chromosome partitioning ATPase